MLLKIGLRFFLVFLICVLAGGCGKKDESEPQPAAQIPPGGQLSELKHPNGKIAARGYFVNDKMNGLWTQWYESGKKEREENYVDDLLDGRMAKWDEKGQLKEEAWYKKGKLEGKKITWDENGNVLTETEYKDGVEVSKGEAPPDSESNDKKG